ncbi:TetR/AcrR family transcriptional regulator [Nocardia cyriacigeorgica]|jgi:AcrR family transcriptional regulator|uniref:TetR/AcrR family transcriptional regulator n=2 Tax=Nocardia cyriacigeorgica TaxID=135487 RepID=UPI0002D7465E|nr:TetR/AcrR family transcriptional regulator [Nocardia cyriacigeorgica]AVH23177.1 TetR/AcrR family transcriptional regulator [Nocardia cyriacigeorgica]MBF6322707.1 helix-turn-helix transcriptional regulator [Nocardia cyriacigeorgica]MBF6495432.1 helix-turn-helix transcriptional regulator [Nocardia cyriacigeorgica]PPJ10394.1 TetR/AcrR family transcriptional regulator [Nocardia cyriacigeorgica]TLF55859.1 helix-turn-helix transcriptional regulator [Nocardia cyriacigeorgica]
MTDRRPAERADAARNRRAILDATRALLAEQGAEAITMDRVAAAAGVGKGTIFHRFGNRAGLLHEMVAESAVTLMNAVKEGPPPLGPGAPAGERLVAFFEAMAWLVIDNLELMAAYRNEPPHPRTAEFHQFWFDHITALLRETRPDVDAEVMGRLLLDSLAGPTVPDLVRSGETDRVPAAVRALTESVLRVP